MADDAPDSNQPEAPARAEPDDAVADNDGIEVNGDANNDGDGEEDDEQDDPLDHLPDYVLPRVEKLKDLNEKREEIMTTYLEERASLEKKFQSLFAPLYKERAAVVAGEKDDEIAATTEEKSEVSEAEDRIKGLPQFWVCCMTNMETVGELITEEDVDCLDSIENITCVDDDDGKGFTLRFFFGPNEYFHDTVLSKRYEVPNLLTSDEPILKNVTGCKIQWKQDHSLTFRTVKKKQRGKGKHAGQVRTVTKTEQKESFFHWFDPPEMPSMDVMDEEEAERLEEEFETDYEIAQAFRCHIIPKAILWYTGQAADEEMLQAMDPGMVEGS